VLWELLRSQPGLQDCLGQKRDEAITATLRRSLHLDNVLFSAAIDDEIRTHVSCHGVTVNPPASFAEYIRENAIEFIVDTDGTFRYRHITSPHMAMLYHTAVVTNSGVPRQPAQRTNRISGQLKTAHPVAHPQGVFLVLRVNFNAKIFVV
jgi:hypothetical protein